MREIVYKYSDIINGEIISADLRVVLYDVTMLYLESEKEGSIRQKGYSKDGKVHKTQIVLDLLTDPFGNRYGYKVYP